MRSTSCLGTIMRFYRSRMYMLRLQNKPRVRPHLSPLLLFIPFPEIPPIPDPIILCQHNSPKIRCYTLYCPSQTWKFEDRGTQCGPIPTLSAQLLSASPPANPTPLANDGSQPAAAAAAASAGAGAGARATATATASAAKSSGPHVSSSNSDGATLGMGASSAGAAIKHGEVISWVVVVALWLWSRVLM